MTSAWRSRALGTTDKIQFQCATVIDDGLDRMKYRRPVPVITSSSKCHSCHSRPGADAHMATARSAMYPSATMWMCWNAAIFETAHEWLEAVVPDGSPCAAALAAPKASGGLGVARPVKFRTSECSDLRTRDLQAHAREPAGRGSRSRGHSAEDALAPRWKSTACVSMVLLQVAAGVKSFLHGTGRNTIYMDAGCALHRHLTCE